MSGMKGNFSEIISASIEWTKTVLFRPFRLKKWLMLFIIVLFAFQMQNGCNLRINLPAPGTEKTVKTKEIMQKEEIKAETKPVHIRDIYTESIEKRGKFITIFFIVLIGIGVLALLLVFGWLYSVFSFVFIESVVNNDASIKRPFIRNRSIGNSYFVWNVICFLVFLGILVILAKLGYVSLFRIGAFEKSSQIAFGRIMIAILPYAIIGICVFFIGTLLSFFVYNYVLIVMYKERLPILKAIPLAFSLLCFDIGAFMKYIFVKIGLWIIISLIASAIALCIIIGILPVGGSIAIIIISIYKTLPNHIQTIYVSVLLLLGMPLIVMLIFLMNVAFLPFPVFFKTFNLKFISRIDERYNLFRLSE